MKHRLITDTPCTIVPNNVLLDTRLSKGAFRLFVHLKMKNEGWGYNNCIIAREMNRSTRTIQRRRKELKALGYTDFSIAGASHE